MEPKKSYIFLISIFLFPIYILSCKSDNQANENLSGMIEIERDSISNELMKVLNDEFDLWYPLTIDTVYGGFFSDVNYKWELNGNHDKMIVTQARHVWSTANAAMFYPDKNKYLKIARHGFDFLKNVMLDKEYGGFYNLVNRKGEVEKNGDQIVKQAYGNAFVIYGLAAYYKASGDTAVLNLAIKTFEWFEKYSYDKEYGGYFQFISRDGIPFKDGYGPVPPKDQNSSIHIMEAFTELYKVWPNPKLKERLTSLLHIIRDTITTDKGYMNLFFKRDWIPISYRNSDQGTRNRNYEFDHVSFGHDIETAYLLLEASEVLGIQNDTTTLRVAKKMVDHTVNNGWDKEAGGIFDGGYYMTGEEKISIVKNTKEWWSQIEALNSFLMMSDLFPNDKINYYEKFCAQWDYIKKYVIDNEYGGWYWGGIDAAPNNKNYVKSSIWKCNYHTSRGLINCIRRINENSNSKTD